MRTTHIHRLPSQGPSFSILSKAPWLELWKTRPSEGSELLLLPASPRATRPQAVPPLTPIYGEGNWLWGRALPRLDPGKDSLLTQNPISSFRPTRPWLWHLSLSGIYCPPAARDLPSQFSSNLPLLLSDRSQYLFKFLIPCTWYLITLACPQQETYQVV